jgi:hypothetical protein
MGYLKSAVETSLVYAEQAKIPDYVTSIRKSFKPADNMAAQVEAIVSTHGAPLVTKIDLKLDPVVDAATEKYGMAKEKCTTVIEYAQTKKDGVVSYAVEKKEGVIMKVKDTRKTVTAATEDIVRQVKTGEIEKTILTKAEKAEWNYTAGLVKTLIGYKGKILVNAQTVTTQIKTKSDAQIAVIKAYAMELKGKLPIAAVKAKVAVWKEIIEAKSSPYVAKATPYYAKAKTELNVAKSKVYAKFMELKQTYLAKKTA